MKIPTSLYSSNIKHLSLIIVFLKILQPCINKIYYLIDHDFRILTKFVSQFLDFYPILYRMYKFSLQTNLEKHLEIEKASGGHAGPAGPPVARARAPARATQRPSTTHMRRDRMRPFGLARGADACIAGRPNWPARLRLRIFAEKSPNYAK
jgi:hypothetical protein